MTPERWRRIDELFNEALAVAPNLRAEFIQENCRGDQELQSELESLLASDEAFPQLEGIVKSAAQDYCAAKDTLAGGTPFGHYQILSMLGSGGMGQVYLAADSRLRRKVALKTLSAGVLHDRRRVQRFEQEAQTASALNHPNILVIYEIGENGGTHYIASEFVEGATLRAKLLQGRLGVDECVDIACQIAAGLSAAHSVGIVHRDVKPENVIVRKDGLVKIVDFGIAKLGQERSLGTQSPSEDSISTRPGMILGTVRYMSPEQARGFPVSTGTDVFSLGVVLYEMLSGKAPFEGDTDSDLVAEVLKSDPPALCDVAPQVPPRLSEIVTHAMHKDFTLRYPSARELSADLQTFKMFSENQYVRDATQGAVESSTPGRRLLRWLLPALCVLALIAAALVVWKRSTETNVSRPRSLAILPFRNIRQDPSIDFLGFSLADAVITKLGYVSAITVRPSSAIDKYRNVVIDPRRVGSELNVDTLLTGNFVRDGDVLRINTQLVDVKHDKLLWQDTIDTPYEDLLNVQDRVAHQIISGLALNLSPAESQNLSLDNPTSQGAYEDYLRGVDLYSLNAFASAIQVLEKSAAAAPNYALTWAHLGRAYTTDASLQFGGRDEYRKAQDAYEKALQLNPHLIEARIYMANLFTDTGRAEQSVPLLLTALKTNRNSAEAHWELGYAYRFGGMLPDSVHECERARQLDPEVKLTTSALNSYLYIGEYSKFLASLPMLDSAYILFYRGFGEYYEGNRQAAAGYFGRSFALDPSLLQAQIGEALALGLQHKNVEGLRLLKQTESKVAQRGVSDAEGIYKMSEAYAVLGDTQSALRVFRKAIDGGFFCYPYFVTDSLLNSVRTNPEFGRLLERARERHETFERKFSARLP